MACTDICLFTHSVSKYLGTCKVKYSSRFSDDHRADPVFMEFVAELKFFLAKAVASMDTEKDPGLPFS